MSKHLFSDSQESLISFVMITREKNYEKDFRIEQQFVSNSFFVSYKKHSKDYRVGFKIR